jgi:phospholipase/carboxylesterase
VSAPRPLTIVALHGVAWSGEEIESLSACVPERVRLPAREVRWVFPRAEQRALSIFGGRPALAWYDILANDRSRLDDAGIEQASQRIRDLVHAERALMSAEGAIVLVGYSQGGALALQVGLQLGGALQGVAAVSAALPYPERISEAVADAPRVFLGHGRFDRLVPYALGVETAELLRVRGYAPEWRGYWGGHALMARTLGDVRRWLDRCDAAEPARDGLAAA